MLPTVVPKLFQVEGGNVQVPKKLLEWAQPHLTIANVTHIYRLSNGSYTITSQHHASNQVCWFLCIEHCSAVRCQSAETVTYVLCSCIAASIGDVVVSQYSSVNCGKLVLTHCFPTVRVSATSAGMQRRHWPLSPCHSLYAVQ